MKQLKILFFCMGILLNGFTLHSQTGDNDKLVLKLPEYEIKNPIIYGLLDSLDMLSEECIFCLLNKPYFYDFYLIKKDSTIEISVGIEQDNCTFWEFSLKTAKNRGFFYHNQKNVPIIGCKIPDYASLSYQYLEGELYKKGITRKCSKEPYFYRKIQEGDSWEFLLNECKCTEEILDYVDGKYVGELPKVGDELIIEYILTDNKEVTMNRISYETMYPVKKRIRFLNTLNRITPIYQNGFYIGILF